jgi:hypothetical protein
MRTVIFILSLLCVGAGYAQDKKGYDRLNFSFTLQAYHDKESVKSDGGFPGRSLYPCNAYCRNWGLQYERVTPSGLIWGGGIQYGRRNYVMSMAQDMREFDPEWKRYNSEYRTGMGSASTHVRYWGGRVFVGYRKPIGRNWAATARAGMAEKFFRKGYPLDLDIDIHYSTVDGPDKEVPAGFLELKNGGRKGTGMFKSPNAMLSYECLLSVERAYKTRYLKTLSIGIEGTRGVWMWGQNEAAVLYSSPNINQLRARKETFMDRGISLGLRVAVGLWK